MDDLQLLELLEKAKEKQKGPKGEPGVSVEKIEQFDDDSFTIFLSNGYSKKIQLFAGKDGEVGQQGVAGPKGDPGVSGRAGNDGADGLAGETGPRGTDGSYVDTALVNGSGDLLLSLSTGEIINVGRVVGPAGATGAAGPTGVAGADGKDGAAVLTGPRAPQESDGKEGDTWIDVSSAEFGFYKKSGNGWSKLANLRQPAKDTRVGAGAGGGSGQGGGGKLQNTATLPLANPTVRNAKGLPDLIDLKSQADYNNWLYTALEGIVAGGGGGGVVDLSDYATIKYVDDSIAAIPPTDLSDYAKTEYVDDEIEAAGEAAEKYVDDKISKLPPGMKAGGKTGQVLAKKTDADYVTEWIDANGGTVSVQDTPPANPETGALWFDSEEDELTLYLYTGTEWIPAAPPVSLDGINSTINAALVVQSDLVDRVQEAEAEQNQIKLDLEELQVTKGSVARYKITATNIGAAGRNGELYVNNAVATDVQAMSFAPFDLNGQPIKPCNTGDIIELVQAVALASVGEVSRYRIVSGDSNALTVEYLSGTNDFEADQAQEVYIYPQNEAGASKDYVDEGLAGKLNNAGGNDLVNGTDWKVRQQNTAGSNKTLIQVKEGELGLYNLKEPTQSHHAATKSYVDSVGGGPRPAQLSWIYDGTKNSASAPSDGKFYKNDDYLRFSFKAHNGVDLSNGLAADTGAVVTEYGPIGVIWYYSVADNSWKMKRQFRTQSWRWNYNNHFEFMLSSSKGHAWSSFTKDAVYYITIGGWF